MEKGWKHKMAKGGGVGKKVYNTMFGVGSSKYVINYHNGVKTHKDGSEFFDIATFKNKVDFNKFVNKLKNDGYVQGHEHGGKMAKGGGVSKYSIDEYDLETLQSTGVSINQMKEILEKAYPDSFGFTLYEIKGNTPTNARHLIPDTDNYYGIKNNSLKISFDKHHAMNYKVYQGGENTYFYFMLQGNDNEAYIGSFGFKDAGDVPKEYVTSFTALLNKLYGFPFQVSHEVYAKGGGLKSSNNVYKLRAEGLNDFLAFLQEGMYFRVKSFTVETTSGPDVVVSFETDASLSEIKSKLDEVPDSHVMLETVMPINEYTGERNEEYAKGGGVGESKLEKLKNEGKLKTLIEVNGQKYFQTILPNKQEKGYWKRYYSTNQSSIGVLQNSMLDEDDLINLFEQQSNKMAKGGGVGSSNKLKYSLYLDRTVGDDVTTYHIADFAAKGDLSIALESLKEAAPKNYMYYTK